MKSLKSVFRSSKKSKGSGKEKQENKDEPTKPISSPSPSHASTLPQGNEDTEASNGANGHAASARSIRQHSTASSISRSGISIAQSSPVPAVPALPATLTDSSSVVDLAGYAQPQSMAAEAAAAEAAEATEATEAAAATAPSEPSTPRRSPAGIPSNPQLTADSPLVRTQNTPVQLDNDTRPTEYDLRSPHTTPAEADAGAVVDTSAIDAAAVIGVSGVDPEDAHALHRSSTLPPSYNSLNIPLNSRTNIHEASAPSPDVINAGARAAITATNGSPSTASASVPYVAPPPPSSSPLANHIDPSTYQNNPLPLLPNEALLQHQHQQPYQQPYAMPDTSALWGAQQAYSPAASSSQHYGHRPYVMPGGETQSYPIIMAIDWGTTYSSMAYAYQQDGEVHEVSTW